MEWWQVDWRSMFVPQISLLEIFLRGSGMYLVLLVLMRIFRRQAGSIGISDLLVIVLIADASQNAMSGDYKSMPEGALLVLTIIAWDQFLDWLGFHVPLVERLLRAPPTPLVKNGRMIARNLRHELITRDELMSQLRQQGVDDLAQVRAAFLEGDGKMSVIRKGGGESQGKSQGRGDGTA